MFRKIICLNTILALSLSLFLVNFSQTKAYTEVLDQSYNPGSYLGVDDLDDPTNHPIGQTFRPTKNRLTKVVIEVYGLSNKSIDMFIKDPNNNTLGTSSAVIDEGWYDFHFAVPIALTPDIEYKIMLGSFSGGSSWVYGETGDYGTYPRGYSITGGQNITYKDYHFKTYGYDVVTEQPQEEPKKEETATPKPPTNLEALDTPEDEGESIDLTWEASTTSDIDGYTIYRSETSGKGYQKIDTVDERTLKYSDETAETSFGEETTIYYYVVRAYKGEKESKNSNQTEAMAIDNKAPEPPQKVKLKKTGKDSVELSWQANTEEDLESYQIRYGTDSKVYSETLEVGKETSRAISGLLKGLTYYFVVLAKDTHGNVSEPSSEVKVALKEINWIFWGSIITLGLLGKGFWLYFAHKNKKWPFKAKLSKEKIGEIEK